MRAGSRSCSSSASSTPMLLWSGDVLLVYALLGFALLGLRRGSATAPCSR